MKKAGVIFFVLLLYAFSATFSMPLSDSAIDEQIKIYENKASLLENTKSENLQKEYSMAILKAEYLKKNSHLFEAKWPLWKIVYELNILMK